MKNTEVTKSQVTEVTSEVNEDRRKALGKLKYAPPIIATLMATDTAWAQISGGPPPPPAPGP